MLSREQVRNVDRRAVEDYAMPSIVLMENAGRGAAQLLREAGVSGPVVICCGRGNNGGDGFTIARHLENAGCDVRVVLLADPDRLKGDALTNYRILQKAGTPLLALVDFDRAKFEQQLEDAEWIVDALLGTGVQGELREPYPQIIEAINAAGARVLAVDLPSGLDCDSGEPLGPCIRAELTATFVASKVGFETETARQYLGTVHVIDIGVPRRLLEE